MLDVPARLIAALIAVESAGNDSAVGPRGEVGCLQVRECVIADVNRILWGRGVFTRYALGDMFDRPLAIRVCRIYLGYYGDPWRLGRQPTEEDLARIWNGGPRGYFRPSTLPYWERVRAHLTERQPVAQGTAP